MTTTKLAHEAIGRAGFSALWGLIDDLGCADADDALRLKTAPLLVLGALADHARELWMGERVLVMPPIVAEREPAVTLTLATGDTGLEFVRAVAIARLTTPANAHVRVDWASAGLEMVQAALLFGADQIVGTVVTKAGLPLADQAARALRKADVAGLIKRAGRLPVFVTASGREQAVDAPRELPAAHRAASMLGIAGDETEGGAL